MSARLVAIDCESWLIRAGLLVPKLVCLTAADDTGSWLLAQDEAVPFFKELLNQPETIILGHNLAYDLALLIRQDPLLTDAVFEAFSQGRFRDTITRAKLLDIASGERKFLFGRDPETNMPRVSKNRGYSLEELSLRFLKKQLAGKSAGSEKAWRLRYAELASTPVDKWPAEARDYAIGDAVVTRELYLAMEKHIKFAAVPVEEEKRQTENAFALHVLSCWGLRTDPEKVSRLKKKLLEEQDDLVKDLGSLGVFWRDGIGKLHKRNKKLQELVAKAYAAMGEPTPHTLKGSVAYDEETLLGSGDDRLDDVAELSKISKLLDAYVPMLEQGTSKPICCRYDTLKETGRTSSYGSRPKKKSAYAQVFDGANIQNPPRRGGVRECFVPRPGWIYIAADYSTLELCTLAQSCLSLLGHSQMAEAIKKGEDLHLSFAASMMGISYEEAKRRLAEKDPDVKDARQTSKICNFGYPGGLSAKTFVSFFKGSIRSSASSVEEYRALVKKFDFNVTKSKALKDAFFRRWVEMRDYFDLVDRLCKAGGGHATVKQLGSGRVRGRVSYTATANGFFQALAADLAQDALRRVVRECFTGVTPLYGLTTSPLYGCRPVMFIHDEIVLEVPYFTGRPGQEARASAAADRLVFLMEAAGNHWCPDVPIKAQPSMMRYWIKGAEEVRDESGLLIPFEPKAKVAPKLSPLDQEEELLRAVERARGAVN